MNFPFFLKKPTFSMVVAFSKLVKAFMPFAFAVLTLIATVATVKAAKTVFVNVLVIVCVLICFVCVCLSCLCLSMI